MGENRQLRQPLLSLRNRCQRHPERADRQPEQHHTSLNIPKPGEADTDNQQPLCGIGKIDHSNITAEVIPNPNTNNVPAPTIR